MFSIGAPAGADSQLRVQYGGPVPFGTGRYYPLENRAAPDDAKVYNSDLGLFNTGVIFPRQYATGTPTGSDYPLAYATGTSTGSVSGLRGAAVASSSVSPFPVSSAQKVDLSGLVVVNLVSLGCVLLLLWI